MPFRTCIQTKNDGIQCGSPAMRKELRCYFHYHQQKPIKRVQDLGDISTPRSRDLAIQTIYRAMSHRRIDADVAGKLLYAIQMAMQA